MFILGFDNEEDLGQKLSPLGSTSSLQELLREKTPVQQQVLEFIIFAISKKNSDMLFFPVSFLISLCSAVAGADCYEVLLLD